MFPDMVLTDTRFTFRPLDTYRYYNFSDNFCPLLATTIYRSLFRI